MKRPLMIRNGHGSLDDYSKNCASIKNRLIPIPPFWSWKSVDFCSFCQLYDSLRLEVRFGKIIWFPKTKMNHLALLYSLNALLQESSKAFMEYSNHEAAALEFAFQLSFLVSLYGNCNDDSRNTWSHRVILSFIAWKSTTKSYF